MAFDKAKLKDRILDNLIARGGSSSSIRVAQELGIEHYTSYTLLKEMAEAGHIKTISTANPNDTYGYVVDVLPDGMMFRDMSSYEEEARSKWFEDVPKKYWFFTAIFAIIAFALPLYLQYCNKPSQSQSQLQQTTETPISDTVSAHH